MKIHEYQAKQLLQEFNVPIPQGGVAADPHEAYQVAEAIGGMTYVVKAQIHAGGRGKGGGVKVAADLNEVRQLAESILGMTLVTHQTGPEGRVVKKVLVEQALDIKQELYLGIVIDRAQARPVIMISAAGGMEIEEVAARTPELIIKEAIDPAVGLMPYQTRNLAFGVGLEGGLIRTASGFITNLYRMFMAYDCSLVEINPLVVTTDGQMLALDAKVNFDDNALYRHKELLELEDPNEMDPLELEAKKHNLNYIRLDGTVGAMVNGAGLAMATMDLIKLAGAEPANFLDVGGGASADMITNGFRIILGDPRVKAILINIFGGILRCDVLAQGVLEAVKQVQVQVPIIIRLEGTHCEIGRDLLKDSGLNFTVASDMLDAAHKVAALAK
ncbi:MAG: ADP-forming succinate--CoA ligase subunit beta [Deltaproteobacteria bacterium]|nr:ADP-forming succinate--CoA ligase subunit beta [Deltaproteobacteria bacterium]MBW1986712.1 ADP-forming succinate--CoA ligase subunit beta [Deltaproteobacteria bacterium]MBW2134558.1 ADP-forming succinate--CoA ligase subunit beta [Deltaproteobacteria bacterium]